MNFKFAQLGLKNFLSSSKIQFSFSDHKGQMVLVIGENKDDELASSNGAGKSVLLEGVNFALFGRTARDLKYADEVINDNAKDCHSWLTFYIDDQLYEVIRSRTRGKPTELEIYSLDKELLPDADNKAKQDFLENLIGFNWITFSSTMMFHQDFIAFPDLKPADRAKILVEVGRLEDYVQAESQAKEAVKANQQQIQNINQEIDAKKETVKELLAIDYNEKVLSFEEDRTNQVNNITEQINNLSQECEDEIFSKKLVIKEIESSYFTQEEAVKFLRTQVERYKVDPARIIDLRQKVTELTKQTGEYFSDIRHLQEEIRKYVHEGGKMLKLDGAKCPTCLQDVTHDHVEKCYLLIKEKKTNAETHLSEKQRFYDGLQSDKIGFEDELKRLEQSQRKSDEYASKEVTGEKKLSEIKHDLNSAQATLESYQSVRTWRINELVKQKQDKEKEVNPYIELRTLQENQVDKKQQEIEIANTKLVDIQSQLQYNQYWVEGFKRIRMMLFDSLVSRLNELSQENLMNFTSEIEVMVTGERQTKTGVREEIHIQVASNDKVKSYPAYSGGERQKIKMAVSLALSQVIEELCDRTTNFMFFDEPNNALDDIGKDSNLQAFRSLAEEGIGVMVIDHDAYFQDSFNEVITVVKEKGESYVRQ